MINFLLGIGTGMLLMSLAFALWDFLLRFHRHDWGHWEQVDGKLYPLVLRGRSIPCIRNRRTCHSCGLVQTAAAPS